MAPIFMLGFFILGIVHWFAVFAAFNTWMDLHWIIAGALSLALAFTPIIGTGLAIAGAIKAWGMSGLGATALFVGPTLLLLIFSRRT